MVKKSINIAGVIYEQNGGRINHNGGATIWYTNIWKRTNDYRRNGSNTQQILIRIGKSN